MTTLTAPKFGFTANNQAKTTFNALIQSGSISPTLFRDNFIPRFEVVELPISVITDALQRSEDSFEQFPVDGKRVEKLAASIASEGILYQSIVLASIPSASGEDELFGIGGRHRDAAIEKLLKQLQSAHPMFANLPEQTLPVIVYHYKNLRQLLTAIQYDNASRRMSKPELTQLAAQELGLDLNNTENSVATALSDATVAERVKVLSVLASKALGKVAVNTASDMVTYLSRTTVSQLATMIATYLVKGTIPRPACPKYSIDTCPEGVSLDEANVMLKEEHDSRYMPSPKFMLSDTQQLEHLDEICADVVEILSGYTCETNFPAREVIRPNVTHDVMVAVHSKVGEVLESLSADAIAAQAAKKESKTKKATSIVANFSAMLGNVEGLTPDQQAQLQALLTSAITKPSEG